MDLHILSFNRAKAFQPGKRTYAIQIFGGSDEDQSRLRDYPKSCSLTNSPNYVRVAQYIFDEWNLDNFFNFREIPKLNDKVWLGNGYYCRSEGGYDMRVTLDEGLAVKMLTDFALHGHKAACEALLVHCLYGRNRSPAVAMALNEVFGLGHDIHQLEQKYPLYNRYAFGLLLNVAKEMGL